MAKKDEKDNSISMSSYLPESAPTINIINGPVEESSLYTVSDLTTNSVYGGVNLFSNENAVVVGASAEEIAANNKAANLSSTLSAIEAEGEASAYSVNAQYQSGQGRLLSFNYNNGGDDSNKRAYFKLGGSTQAFKDTIMSTSASYTQLISIYNQLMSKYQAFILLNLQENLQERQMIMPTVGDTFAATFSGADPQIVSINGILPFDNSSDKSWFVHFMNMYVRFIRASVLAKNKCWLELVVPDYQAYKCYPISITFNLDSNTDTVVQFGMSCVVANDWSEKAYGYTATAFYTSELDKETAEANSALKTATVTDAKQTTDKSNTQGTQQTSEEADTKSKAESGQDNSPKTTGEKEKSKNVLKDIGNYVNKVSNSVKEGLQKSSGIKVNGKTQSWGSVLGAGTKLANKMLNKGTVKGRNTTLSVLSSALTKAGKTK